MEKALAEFTAGVVLSFTGSEVTFQVQPNWGGQS